ncbi:MAG: SUMF1/EgtB/PvdO family nonheme iron enzyme [Desulforegulaceae bacterium]|nr:SUMF1/EgtB/PvdO family nonheme iron enzyme [Desulforegulaceae bacterium]
MKKRVLYTIVIFFVFGVFVSAQEISKDLKKTALVIGNGSYLNSPLSNPQKDAEDIADTLNRLGFEVILKTNKDQVQMDRAVNEFKQKLHRKGGVGLFYYAGHGIQVDGENYLIPVGSEIMSETDVKYKALALGQVLGYMHEAKTDLNILIIDACRNNPVERKFRSASRGLARVRMPESRLGYIVCYSTEAGEVALDGDGENSPFALNLIKELNKTNNNLSSIFRETRINVCNQTNYQQRPLVVDGTLVDFIFNPSQSGGNSTSDNPGFTNWQKYQDAMKKSFEMAENSSEKFDFEDNEKMWNKFLTEYSTDNPYSVEDDELRKKAQLYKNGFTNFLGMEFVYIRPGTFTIGSSSSESGHYDREKQHKVILTKGYFMQTTEVTIGQYRKYLQETGDDTGVDWKDAGCPLKKNSSYSLSGNRFGQSDKQPMVEISWHGAKKFADWLSKKDGITYRLPTEAEWEYAARADTITAYCFGDNPDFLKDYAWYGDNSGYKTHEVGLLKPNQWGLYDMHGNVWEWCEDRYADYPSGHVTDPSGPGSSPGRVLRGGGWLNIARYCRSAYRDFNSSGDTNDNSGFRLAAFRGRQGKIVVKRF